VVSVSSPIVYVDRSRIVSGRFDELLHQLGELASLVERDEPRIVSYAAFVDRERAEVSVVHVHRDAASLATHFRVAAPAFGDFVDLVQLRSIDVYGSPTEDLVAQLHEKARLLGSATVAVHPSIAGFIR
jgi:hypothetical protein